MNVLLLISLFFSLAYAAVMVDCNNPMYAGEAACSCTSNAFFGDGDKVGDIYDNEGNKMVYGRLWVTNGGSAKRTNGDSCDQNFAGYDIIACGMTTYISKSTEEVGHVFGGAVSSRPGNVAINGFIPTHDTMAKRETSVLKKRSYLSGAPFYFNGQQLGTVYHVDAQVSQQAPNGGGYQGSVATGTDIVLISDQKQLSSQVMNALGQQSRQAPIPTDPGYPFRYFTDGGFSRVWGGYSDAYCQDRMCKRACSYSKAACKDCMNVCTSEQYAEDIKKVPNGTTLPGVNGVPLKDSDGNDVQDHYLYRIGFLDYVKTGTITVNPGPGNPGTVNPFPGGVNFPGGLAL